MECQSGTSTEICILMGLLHKGVYILHRVKHQELCAVRSFIHGICTAWCHWRSTTKHFKADRENP